VDPSVLGAAIISDATLVSDGMAAPVPELGSVST